jgi:hypothetical protein
MSNPGQNTPNNSITGLSSQYPITYVSNFSGYPIASYTMMTSESLSKENENLKKIILAKEEIIELKEELADKEAKIRVIEKNFINSLKTMNAWSDLQCEEYIDTIYRIAKLTKS